MKSAITIVLMTAVLFGGGYWSYTALAGCNVPISYRIGTIDERFNMSTDEVRNAVSTAESIWEDGTDRNLFTYDSNGKLVVNFVYDERQALTEEEGSLKAVLDRKEGMSDSVKTQYKELVSQYELLRASYEAKVKVYETKLNVYNKEVADWNTRGGAPKDVFARLESTQESLATEEKRINELSTQLNALVRKINNLGSQGNNLVSDYNSLVSEYNQKFSEGKEFTQGEYQNSVITIYEFTTPTELAIVLAHEMGHVLDINHVEGANSIMYHLMKEQSPTEGLTAADQAAFTQSCGNKGSMADTLRFLRETLEGMLRSFKG